MQDPDHPLKTLPPTPTSIPLHLQREWRIANLGCTIFVIGFAAFIGISLGWVVALRWAILPVFLAGYFLWFIRRHLNENYGENGILFPSMGWGNALTLIRAMLIACLGGFLLLPRPTGLLAWMPGLLYTLAVIADFFDGYLARKTNQVTRLGGLLDMEADSWGMLFASLLLVRYDQVPFWYVGVGLARYLFLGGMALRNRFGLINHPLPESITRRLFAGLQMGMTCVLLWPIFKPPGTLWAATFFSLPLFLGFIKDWLLICGWLKPSFGKHFKRISRWVMNWLPLVLRALAVIVGFTSLGWLPWPLGGWMLVVNVLLILGIAPRAMTVLGILILANLPAEEQSIPLLAIYTALLYLGGGQWCLWRPEEKLIRR